jgi:tRNA threonylcarbamoyladenosine modification (KEOPS) complex  Pcc1 subunit
MPNWVITSTITFHFKTKDDATIFYTSYLPEHGKVVKSRSETLIQQEESRIVFTINATDITAYRATVNSLLQFSNVAYKLIERIVSQKE